LAEDHPIAAKILEHRQIAKLHSTYVESLPQQMSPRDKRVHGEFNQATTATGRLSSTNPNLQNIPIKTDMGKQIRRAFIASDEDHVILSADYSQIELRLLAHMSADEKLMQAFKDDEDVHKRTAAAIFEVPPSSVTPEQRNVGKTLNFALVYRQGPFATAQQLGITTNEAKTFIDRHFAAFPKIKSFMDRVIEEARERSYVETLWGRRRYFANLRDGNRNVREADERAACNAPLQGSAADLIKLAMIRLDKELAARNLHSKLILQVHDELVLDVPKAELEETKAIVRECMAMDQPLSVPLRIDMGVGPNWMDAK
jgi:DNA polymerase-1